MRPVRCIHEEEFALLMQEVRNCRQLCRHTVVRRIDEERGARLGVLAHGTFHGAQRHPHRNAEPCVNLRLHIDGTYPRKDHRPHNRAVHIARHEEHIPRRKRSEQHGVECARRPIHHEVRRIPTVRLRRQLLRRTDAARRRMEIVELRRERDIRTQPLLCKEAMQHGMRPAPALVPRRVTGQNTKPRIAEHSLGERRVQASSIMRFCTRRCTFVPLPGSERIWIAAPMIFARSSIPITPK